MRGPLAVLIVVCALGGCADAAGPTVPDALPRTCANTSCVAGASCVLPGGVTCRCYETAAWTCGNDPSDGSGGALFDASIPDGTWSDPAPPHDAMGPDAGTTAVVRGSPCDEHPNACAEVTQGELKLRELMYSCGLGCTLAVLDISEFACAHRITLDREWVMGGLECIAREVAPYRWPCSRSLSVRTTSCPD